MHFPMLLYESPCLGLCIWCCISVQGRHTWIGGVSISDTMLWSCVKELNDSKHTLCSMRIPFKLYISLYFYICFYYFIYVCIYNVITAANECPFLNSNILLYSFIQHEAVPRRSSDIMVTRATDIFYIIAMMVTTYNGNN